MRSTIRRIAILTTLVCLLGVSLTLTAGGHPANRTITGAPGEVINVQCQMPDGSIVRPAHHQHSVHWSNICPAAPAQPTATATATATHTPAPTLNGWHAPGTHDALNVHEHGDSPPQFVLNSGNPPFTQTRESHTGYKGVYDVSPGGVESYFIGHIISTEAARSHGDHDYQLWLRDPDTGQVFYWDGLLCFAEPCTAPIEEKTVDDGERPIVLGERSASDGCETWYGFDEGRDIVDVGWTVCQRYQAFDGTVLGGDGSFRTVDFIIPCDRLPSGSPLLNNCRVEFNVSRLSFLVNSREYESPAGSVDPVN